MKNTPYLSFVVVGRNDDYGGRFLERFQRCLSNIIFLCDKHKLSAELVIVEWNPPGDKKRLRGVMDIPSSDFLEVRFIEVPKKIHDKVGVGLGGSLCHEYLGKNVGIRRARGEFVLATNSDIIFSDRMIEFLSQKKLRKDTVYRTNRYDLFKEVPENLNGDNLLKFCEQNWGKEQSIVFGHSIRGLRKIYYLPRMIARALLPYLKKKWRLYKHHAGAPGDFTLMSKDAWVKIRAYPEIGIFVLLDVYAVQMAVAQFGKFCRIPKKIYHQYHTCPLVRGKACLRDQSINMEKYKKDSMKMLKERKAIRYNSDDWGMKGVKLKETLIQK